MQWRGLQMLYVHFLKDPLNIVAFASQSEVEPAAVINLVVQLLQQGQLHEDPGNGFSDEMQNLQNTTPVESHLHLPSVLQAQLSGLALSILLILSLSDSVSLKQLLHEAEAEHLLLRLARNETSNAHPYLRHKVLEKECPAVLSKLVELYRWVHRLHVCNSSLLIVCRVNAELLKTDSVCDDRLIPLAMLCICEAAGVWDTFHQQMVSSTYNMRRMSERYSVDLHNQLMDEVTFLQQIRGGAGCDPSTALVPMKYQDLANHVTGSIAKHSTKLHQAFQSAIDGYDKHHTGNCLLFFAPHQAKLEAAHSAVQGSDIVLSCTEGTVPQRSASKSSASKKTSAAGWQPRSAAWLAVVTFTTGFVVGAAGCTMRQSSRSP